MRYQGLTIEAISELCSVSLETARRWKKGQRRPGAAAESLLQLAQDGRILPPSWSRYARFIGDRLCHTNGESIAADELASFSWYRGALHFQLKRLEKAEEYIAYLERVTPRAPVVEIKRENMRPSMTAKLKGTNPYITGD